MKLRKSGFTQSIIASVILSAGLSSYAAEIGGDSRQGVTSAVCQGKMLNPYSGSISQF